jgi:hypothetical protein
MGKSVILVLVLTGIISLIAGCSGSGNPNQNSPAVPSIEVQLSELPVAQIDESETGRSFMGSWIVDFDVENLTCKIEENRTASQHFAVTSLLPPPIITLHSFNPVTFIADADITIQNPFAINGYDLRVIIFTDSAGHMLTNADDWTSLYDIPQGLPINPFKAYAKNETNRIFASMTQHTENFKVYLPGGNYSITLAIDASYPGNCQEPYEIYGFTQGILDTAAGSSTNANIRVNDWQNNVSGVSLYCPVITGTTLVPFSYIEENKWGMDLVNTTGAPANGYDAFIVAWSSDSGDLALYDKVRIIVGNIPPLDYNWALVWGDRYDMDICSGIAFENYDGFVATGTFRGTVDMNPGPGSDLHTSTLATLDYTSDFYLTKFGSEGNFQWSRTWGGTGYETAGKVATDSIGNIYVTGAYNKAVDFDPGPGQAVLDTKGAEDTFVSKFDPSGNWQWTIAFGSTGSDVITDIFITDSDLMYLTGYFEKEIVFVTDPYIGIEANGNEDAFLIKFNTELGIYWAKSWGSSYEDYAYGLVCDQEGRINVTGAFQETVDFDPGDAEDEHTSNGWYDVFLTRFNSTGEYLWTKTWGGIGYAWDRGIGVAVDNENNVYVTGSFLGEVDFNTDPEEEDVHNSSGERDAFLSKFDPEGAFQWAKTWGGENWDEGRCVTTGSENRVFVSGTYHNLVDFDPDDTGVLEITSKGYSDIFLSKFNTEGDYFSTLAWGGTQQDYCYDMFIDPVMSLYISGDFRKEVDFDPSNETDMKTSKGENDAYVVKYTP